MQVRGDADDERARAYGRRFDENKIAKIDTTTMKAFEDTIVVDRRTQWNFLACS